MTARSESNAKRAPRTGTLLFDFVSMSERVCSCGSGAPASRDGSCQFARAQRRADGFRVPRVSGCIRGGESDAELREARLPVILSLTRLP
jgi:hypothetical protein